MSVLERAEKPKREPLAATIVGTAGSGKTSLGASFPKPVFIRTQGETIPRDIDEAPDMLPVVSNSDTLREYMIALLRDEHDYKTVVFDSCTGLDQMFTQEILEGDPKARGINQALGGYGAGPNAVQARHMSLRKTAEMLRSKRGMNVVFLAHADIVRIDPPDTDGFSQYSLRLPGKSMAPYVDNVDLVGFIKQEVIVKGEEGPKRAVTTGDRVLVTYLNPAFVTKNRFGITEDIPLVKGENPLAFLLDEPKKRGRPPKKQEVEIDETEEADAAADAQED